jgi:hypothetical protein
MFRRAFLAVFAATGGLLVGIVPRVTDAKASFESGYGFERTWTCAVRLLRVDYGFKLTEKDDVSGYLIFDYRSNESGGKTTTGSLEIVRGREPREPVHVLVQLPQMPRYHEQVLADALARKLRNEYGEAPSRPRSEGRDGDAGAGS